jgi:tetratricopeptide (TPR) repeat protein
MAWTEAKETKKEEIEAKVKVIGGDMLKLEYLENCLKKPLTFDVRKYVYMELAKLYEARLMFNEAARNISGAAEISITFKDKMQLYMQTANLLIRHGSYDVADKAFEKALVCANMREKNELKKKFKEMYMQRAKEFEDANKFNNAIRIYEKLPVFGFVNEEEKRQINTRLIGLYNKVGKIQEAMKLERK